MRFEYLIIIGRSAVASLKNVVSWSSSRKRKLRIWMMVSLIFTSRVTLKFSAASRAMASAMTGWHNPNFLIHYQIEQTLSFDQSFMCQRLTSKFTTEITMRQIGLITYLFTLNSDFTEQIVDWPISRSIGCVDGMIFLSTCPSMREEKHMNTQATKQLVPSAPDLTNMIMAEKLYGWISLRWLVQKETR